MIYTQPYVPHYIYTDNLNVASHFPKGTLGHSYHQNGQYNVFLRRRSYYINRKGSAAHRKVASSIFFVKGTADMLRKPQPINKVQ